MAWRQSASAAGHENQYDSNTGLAETTCVLTSSAATSSRWRATSELRECCVRTSMSPRPCYFEGDPRKQIIGFEIEDEASLQDTAATL